MVSISDQLLETDKNTPDALFDKFVAASEDPEECFSASQQVEEWLTLVPGKDQAVLRRWIFDGMRPMELGRLLGISPGAARARLCRASDKLRTALIRSEGRRKL